MKFHNGAVNYVFRWSADEKKSQSQVDKVGQIDGRKSSGFDEAARIDRNYIHVLAPGS